MNNTPLNLGPTRYGCTVRPGGPAILPVLNANLGKTITVHSSCCGDEGGFTGLLSSVGDGVCTLVTSSGGGCRPNGCRPNGCRPGCQNGSGILGSGQNRGCGCGCGGSLPALSAARLCDLSNISTVIPLDQICAVSLPNF